MVHIQTLDMPRNSNGSIYIAGHRGMVGAALVRALGWSARIDLTDGIRQTYHWFLEHQGQIRL